MESVGESEFFVEVPEFLDKEQNILDQPPFNGIEKGGVIPEDLFNNKDEGFPALMRVLSRSISPQSEEDPKRKIYLSSHFQRKLLEHVQPQNRDMEKVNDVIRDIKTFLDPYPKPFSYLRDRWEEFDEGGNPKPGAWETVNVRSYAAHLAAMNKLEQGNKLFGLAEELPHMSTASSVVKAIPKKKEVNRTFRLKVHSEALK